MTPYAAGASDGSADSVKWRRNQRVLWRTAPGFLALTTVDGRTVEVDGPGCDIWGYIEDWITEEELVARLSRHYDTEEQVVSPGTQRLLGQLHEQGYVDRIG